MKEVFCGSDRNSNHGLSLKASEDMMRMYFASNGFAYNKTVTSPGMHGD